MLAQESDCDHYVETVTKPIRKKIRQSCYPFDFAVDQDIPVTLKISDRGIPNTLDLMLDFNDYNGLPTALGSTLSLRFVDGTSYSIIARTKNIKTSMIYFALNSLSKQEHLHLIDKLSRIDLRAMEITADYLLREIIIPDTKAVIIRKSVSCLSTASE